MAKAISRRLYLCLALAIAVGCFFERVTTEDLRGSYTAAYAFGNSRLTLNPDGSFLQHVTIENEDTIERKGSWSLDRQRRRVVLNDAIVPDDGYGNLRPDFRVKPSMTVDLPVERNAFGRLRLGPDEGSPYLKDP